MDFLKMKYTFALSVFTETTKMYDDLNLFCSTTLA